MVVVVMDWVVVVVEVVVIVLGIVETNSIDKLIVSPAVVSHVYLMILSCLQK